MTFICENVVKYLLKITVNKQYYIFIKACYIFESERRILFASIPLQNSYLLKLMHISGYRLYICQVSAHILGCKLHFFEFNEHLKFQITRLPDFTTPQRLQTSRRLN